MPTTTRWRAAADLKAALMTARYCGDLADHMVGREDAHHRVGVPGLQNLRRQADGGRGIALHGLGQNLILGESRGAA